MKALAQVVFKSISGLSEDVYVNTFHFWGVPNGDPLTTTQTDAISTALISFYNTTHAPGGAALAGDISSNVSRTANDSTIKVYDLNDAPPRAPFATYQFTLGAATSGAGLPSEVALCLSYAAAMPSGTNRARRRGRIYLGPLGSTNSTSISGDLRPTNTLLNKVAGAGAYLKGVTLPSAMVWSVYSRVDDVFAPVVGGWVDDAFDTQRRRGKKATFRTTW